MLRERKNKQQVNGETNGKSNYSFQFPDENI